MDDKLFIDSLLNYYPRKEHIIFLRELKNRNRNIGKIKLCIENDDKSINVDIENIISAKSSQTKIIIIKKIYSIEESISMELYAFDTMVYYFLTEELEISFDNIKIYSDYLEKDNGKMIDLHIYQRENQIMNMDDKDEKKDFYKLDVEDFYQRKDKYYKRLRQCKKKDINYLE